MDFIEIISLSRQLLRLMAVRVASSSKAASGQSWAHQFPGSQSIIDFKKAMPLLVICSILCMPSIVLAMHPLITDDAGTQGKGKFQFELNGQYDYEKETIAGVAIKETGGQENSILTYGVVDSIDAVLSVPYIWVNVRKNGVITQDAEGWSDTTLEVKWRLYEKDGLSLALKPGTSIPIGDDGKGLGSGKVGYTTFLIITKEMEPWAFHVNLGYKRNENTENNRCDLWHASLAVVRTLTENLKLVADLGVDRNEDKQLSTDPVFILGGVVYSVKDTIDLDLGLKYGLTEPATNYSLLAGLTMRL